MKIALFVEGQSDKQVIPLIARRFLRGIGRDTPIEVRKRHRGQLLDGRKVASFIRWDILNIQPDTTSAVVLIDQECDDPVQFEAMVDAAREAIVSEALPIPVRYRPVRFALESWLIADPQAWTRALGPVLQAMPSISLLRECNPKGALSMGLNSRRFEFDHMKHDLPVASALDIQVAERNCLSLREFLQDLRELAGS